MITETDLLLELGVSPYRVNFDDIISQPMGDGTQAPMTPEEFEASAAEMGKVLSASFREAKE